MKVSELLQDFDYAPTAQPALEQSIAQLTNDSRQIVSGAVFLAIRGINSHALEHLSETQCQQAAAIIYEPTFDLGRFAAYQHKFIALPELHRHVGSLVKRFYAPSFPSPPIGVTGTNGKTSVTHFFSQLSDYAFVGTNGYGSGDKVTKLSHTTPDALLTQKILAELSRHYEGVAMEVSSHAMVLHRVDAVDFGVAVFTNLSQDHLDFHQDMEDYFQAKAKLFHKDSVKTAVINTDDDYGYRLAKDCHPHKRVIAFGKDSRCTEFKEYAHIQSLLLSQRGINAELALELDGLSQVTTLLSPVWGAFNVYNILAATLALFAVGKPILTLFALAQRLRGVKGRMERIDCGDNKTVIIDYAHTPDALKNTLLSLREHMLPDGQSQNLQRQGKIYTVFGCGGDRDKSKRPLMAEAVNRYSDFGIVTDDNPRTEDSQAIIDDILAANIEKLRFQVIPSRKAAIEFGLSRLSPNDVLLIAGKGHEDYQIIGTEKTPFSDHQVVLEWLS